jgi:hydroxylamine dehydrogenase
MSFRSVFIALTIGFALILGAFLVQRARPRVETGQPNADVKTTGKCAECHSRQQYSIVHEYEMSKHTAKGVNCLDCHQPQKGQDADRQDRSRHERFLVAGPSGFQSSAAPSPWAFS